MLENAPTRWTAERDLPVSTDCNAERGPGVHWREVDEMVGEPSHSLCSASESQHVHLEGRLRSSEIVSHARRLENRQKCILKGTWYLGRDPEKKTTPIKVAMMRLKTGEMLIVATSRIKIKTALPIYRSRWGIETLFSCLKTRGFGLEDTHMTAAHKLAALIGILAIALCLAYKAGLWVARVKPPRHNSHGRLQRSLIALGLNAFRKAMV